MRIRYDDTSRNRVLNRFRENRIATGDELQEITGLHKRSVYRIIDELRDRGHIIQSDGSGYLYKKAPEM